MSLYPLSEGKLLIKFISSDPRQIVTPCIKKHGIYKAFGALHGQRLSGTDLTVKLKQTLLVIGGGIL